MSDQRYQMLWDCAYCGTKALLGVTHRHCPTCGAGQDPSRRYFPEPGKEVAVEGHPFVGTDKVCSHCRHPNSAKAAHCVECGAALDEAKAAGTHTDDGVKSSQERINREREAARAVAGPSGRPPPLTKAKARDNKKKRILVAIAATIAAFVAFYAWYERVEQAVVAEHGWAREVQLETFKELDEKSDCSMRPSDARVYNRFADRRTRQVQDGETCREQCSNSRIDLGDGSFRNQRSCHTECTPRYRTESYTVDVCRYRIDRWVKGRLLKSDGKGVAPQWPAVVLASGTGAKSYGKEREQARSGEYSVELKFGKHEVRCSYDQEAAWTKLADGASVTLKLDLFGKPDCADLAASVMRPAP